MLFGKGYLNKNEDKALDAVAKITNQEKLLSALKEIENNRVRAAALNQLDNKHLKDYLWGESDESKRKAALAMLNENRLIDYTRSETKDSNVRSMAIGQLRNQNELQRILIDDGYGVFEKEAAVNNLDDAHASTEALKSVAMTAESPGFGVTAKHGLAAVERLNDQEALLAVATGAKNSTVALQAARKLTDRDKILSFLLQTEDSFNFKTVLPGIELTADEKQRLANEAKLRNDAVMKQLFNEDELYALCEQNRDPELAKTIYKSIWDKERLETLKEILGSGSEADAIDLRLKTIEHMESLKKQGFPAEINEQTIKYNAILDQELSLMGTVKHTVEQQGARIGFDDIYEKSGDALSQAVADRTRLVLTYFLGGPLIGGLMLMGPDHWLSENAKDAIWMVIASLQLSDTENVMKRVSADMSETEAQALIHDILRVWWETVA